MFLRTRVSNLFIKRQVHGNKEIIENCKEIRNRNPRNLERLRIAWKPIGYTLEKPGFAFWHKLNVHTSQRYVSAEIEHYKNGPVIIVSSQELGIKSQLYRTKDVSTYVCVGRVLAQRCLECGITEIYVPEYSITSTKMKLLIEELEKNEICLQEPKRYNHWNKSYFHREDKPWESFE
ncbi:39S ribosomal protein L18, mitochondrial [Colletes gigas]|uniref:39S ribosomal protein L18, mitochondrial n=1 Tax=Colletes gigas TaxID=935657 RepID=UPI001C9A8BBF|nr:39S ribosomal protein L18, mitochondrial [Colletes gigas]